MSKKEKIIDIVDRFNRMNLPKDVYLNGERYEGKAVFINGYNGYNSTPDDGMLVAVINNWACDKEGNSHYLTNKKGQKLRAQSRRGIIKQI